MSETKRRRPSRLLTALLGLAALGLLAGSSAVFLGRFYWAVDLLAHFPTYYALSWAVLALASLGLKRRRLAALALAGVVVNVAVIWPVFAPQASTALASPAGPSTTLRLALVNVLHANRDRTRVLGFLRSCEADIVFVQEVDPWWDATLRGAQTPYRVSASQPREGSFGIAMLVRDEDESEAGPVLTGSRIIEMGDDAERLARPAIEATLSVDGQEVTVLSVHPPPPVSARMAALRDSVLRRAKDWADSQTTSHIVIGDLNTTPWSYAFSILAGDGALVSTLRGRGNQGSWPTTLPMPWLLPIDHCLHSDDLVCLDRSIGPELGSDHRPLIVTLTPLRSKAPSTDVVPPDN